MILVRTLAAVSAAALVAAACSSFSAAPAPDVETPDATADGALDAGWTVAFEDGFEDDADRGWRVVVESKSDDPNVDAGPSGRLFPGPDGRSSARALHAVRDGYPSIYAKSIRLERSAPAVKGRLELGFSVFVPGGGAIANGDGRTQLAKISVPGISFYPGLTRRGFDFTYEADGVYEHRASTAAFTYDAWVRLTLEVDVERHRLAATVDGDPAFATEVAFGTAGAFGVAVGLRTEQDGTPLVARYDDVVIRYR